MKLTKTGARKAGLIIATALMLIGLLQYSQAETDKQDSGFKGKLQKKETASRANHVPVKLMKIGGAATLGGTVIPFQEVTLAAQTPGRVEYIAGFEGEWFKQSAELIRIEATA